MRNTKKGIALMLGAMMAVSVLVTGCGGTEKKENKEEKQEEVQTGKWISDPSGYRYERADKTSPVGQFEMIDGLWYYFDASGIMATGWLYLGDDVFYMHPDGHMAANEIVDGENKVDENGKWIKPQWKTDGTNYWYEYSNGTYPKNQFLQLDGKWYYFTAYGFMATGWNWIGDSSYYFYPDGHMAANETIDGSYVDANGRWVKPQPKQQTLSPSVGDGPEDLSDYWPEDEYYYDYDLDAYVPYGSYEYDYELDEYIPIDYYYDPYDSDNWDRYDVYY